MSNRGGSQKQSQFYGAGLAWGSTAQSCRTDVVLPPPARQEIGVGAREASTVGVAELADCQWWQLYPFHGKLGCWRSAREEGQPQDWQKACGLRASSR